MKLTHSGVKSDRPPFTSAMPNGRFIFLRHPSEAQSSSAVHFSMGRRPGLTFMAALLLLLCLVGQSIAQSNSTALDGWQFNDNSRSSWDILWTCLSTILACTWTALHMNVPKRHQTELYYIFIKGLSWIGAVLAPEIMCGVAAEELLYARSIVARCNAAFRAIESERTASRTLTRNDSEVNKIPESSTQEAAAKELPVKEHSDQEISTRESSAEEPSSHQSSAQGSSGPWRTIHGFCLIMHGLQLQTNDNWTYPVQPSTVAPLIRAGVIKPSHLRARDIRDRAKADSFAKAFTLLQSFWVTCNIIARRGYNLPITPLEISTVAYVANAAITYAVWWYKPKDMATPITIYLSHNRDSQAMQSIVKNILYESHAKWIRRDDIADDSISPIRGIFAILKACVTILSPWNWRKTRGILDDVIRATQGETPSKNPTSAPNDHQTDEERNAETPSTGRRKASNDYEKDYEKMTIADSANLTHFYLLVMALFCGIHVAAYVPAILIFAATQLTFPAAGILLSQLVLSRPFGVCCHFSHCSYYYRTMSSRFGYCIHSNENGAARMRWLEWPTN
ncbi:uncharacterized protein N7459_006970 [Penicillium hispanicum]|uniref:uncharacterized protein n=1 Tax=Penicillium hispanicum TaxID=1080232 RepID=UPI00254106AD|nr:uncharacterized protein N7459_006970 [Penicillium hispanicum]KAJ5578006.1 hypothetical protein N7459_006970 [Penicillium hispanicum]